MQVTTIGLDLAKNIFQVHGITGDGEVAFNRPLRRAQMGDLPAGPKTCPSCDRDNGKQNSSDCLGRFDKVWAVLTKFGPF